MKVKLSRLSLLTVGVMLVCSGQANASSYTYTDLSALAGVNSHVYAINNVGQIVGSLNGNAFLLEGSTVTALASTGGTNTYALAINDSGQAVGQSVIPFPSSIWAWRATVWSGTTMTLLGTLPDTGHSWANAINSAGVVAGLSATHGHAQATVWNGTTPTALGIDVDSQALGINDSGQVVGYAWNSSSAVFHATLWNGTTATTLGSLGGFGGLSEAYAINNAGVVVGDSIIDTVYHATVWNEATITDLGAGFAYAINNAGEIVGRKGAHAALWNGTSYTDLNSFLDASMASEGWELIDAKDINDMGWIVGTAYNYKLGQNRPYLLTPVPEPESYAMLLAGLGLLGAFLRRVKQQTQT